MEKQIIVTVAIESVLIHRLTFVFEVGKFKGHAIHLIDIRASNVGPRAEADIVPALGYIGQINTGGIGRRAGVLFPCLIFPLTSVRHAPVAEPVYRAILEIKVQRLVGRHPVAIAVEMAVVENDVFVGMA